MSYCEGATEDEFLEDSSEEEGPEPPKTQPEHTEPSSSPGKLLFATHGSQVHVAMSTCKRAGGTFCRPPALQPTSSGTKGKTWVCFESNYHKIYDVCYEVTILEF